MEENENLCTLLLGYRVLGKQSALPSEVPYKSYVLKAVLLDRETQKLRKGQLQGHSRSILCGRKE